MSKHKKRKTVPSNSKPPPKQQKPNPQSSTNPKPKKKSPPDPTIPFDPLDRILLIGEGDLSFAKSLVEHHGCADLTATTFDDKETLLEKYDPQAAEHIAYLEEEGQTVLHGVDATKLDRSKALNKGGELFDRILFNFPHVGGKTKDVNRQVRFNQELLVGFFNSCKALLKAPDGTIVVTLFEGEPYTLWNVRDLARHCGLEVRTSFRWRGDVYPGYRHARTLGNVEGNGGAWKGEEREARSYVFGVKGGGGVDKSTKGGLKAHTKELEAEGDAKGQGKRKRGEESDDDEG